MATIDRRSTRDGGDRWRVRIRRRGVTETASFGSQRDAEQWAREVERAIDSGLWTGAAGGRAGPTLGWMVDRYLAARRPSRDTRRQLEWWRRNLGTEAAVAISSRRILQLRRELAREQTARGRRRSPATVNRYLAALSGLFSWALKSDHLQVHPMKGIDPLAEEPGRVRCLSDDEREVLIGTCREVGGLRLQTLVILALSTGARRGELLNLRWSDLNLPEQQLVIRGSGRLRTRTVPLPGVAVVLLRELSKVRRIDGDRVFVEPNGQVRFPRAGWKAALKAAGIKDFRFHDLRHSAASYLARSGASLAEIAEILGTRTLQGVRRYSHLTGTDTTKPVTRLSDELFES